MEREKQKRDETSWQNSRLIVKTGILSHFSVAQLDVCNLASLPRDRRLNRNGIKEVESDAFNGTKMHTLWVTGWDTIT